MPSATSPSKGDDAIAAESPSPPPPQPVAHIPGVRASRFVELHNKTLQKTMTTISYSKFADCFPTIAANASPSLRSIQEQTVQKLETAAKKEAEEIYQRRNLVENLNVLEELIADAKRRKARAIDGEEPPMPAHLLPASSIVAAHLAPQLASQQSQLNAKLQTTQSQNAAFFQTLAAQKKEIEILLDGLEASVKDLENANQALNSEVGTLRQDIRDADVEMNGL